MMKTILLLLFLSGPIAAQTTAAGYMSIKEMPQPDEILTVGSSANAIGQPCSFHFIDWWRDRMPIIYPDVYIVMPLVSDENGMRGLTASMIDESAEQCGVHAAADELNKTGIYLWAAEPGTDGNTFGPFKQLNSTAFSIFPLEGGDDALP